MSAHRYSYLIFRGPIPEGLDLDHQCHTAAVVMNECTGGSTCEHRACVNPWHLEPVTRRLNAQRGYRPTRTDDSECLNGHPRNQENTYTSPSGAVNCRECNRDAKRRWYSKRKATR